MLKICLNFLRALGAAWHSGQSLWFISGQLLVWPYQSLKLFPWERNYPHCLILVGSNNRFERDFRCLNITVGCVYFKLNVQLQYKLISIYYKITMSDVFKSNLCLSSPSTVNLDTAVTILKISCCIEFNSK